MRTDSYDFLYFIHLENFNNLQGLHLIKHFIAGPSGRIAGTGLFFAQNSIAYIKMSQYFANALTTFLYLLSKAPAQPTQKRYSGFSPLQKGQPSQVLLFYGFPLLSIKNK
jgi:hypothetical protein